MRKPIVKITFGRELSALEIENYHSSTSKYLEKDYYVLSTQSIESKETTLELMGDSKKRLSEMEEDDFFNAEKAREEEQLRLVYRLKQLMEEEKNPPVKKEDSIVKSVINKYQQRSDTGVEKYGVTMDRNDLNLQQWLTHLQEELMDATLYIEKLKREI
jgi:hypothetical protein